MPFLCLGFGSALCFSTYTIVIALIILQSLDAVVLNSVFHFRWLPIGKIPRLESWNGPANG